jgi:hypothetical protein
MSAQTELDDKQEAKAERVQATKSDGEGLLDAVKDLYSASGLKELRDVLSKAVAGEKDTAPESKKSEQLPDLKIGGVDDKAIGTAPVDKIGDGRTAVADEVIDTIPRGATVTRATDADGFTKETVSKGGESFVNVYDGDELVSKEYKLADGRKLSASVEDGKASGSFGIEESNGYSTSVMDGKGERRDPQGKLVETVNVIDGKLVYEDVKTHAKRAESFEPPNKDHMTFKSEDLGKYDANTGTLTKDMGDFKTVGSFATGRLDVQTDSGMVAGMAVNGEISYQNQKTGEAAVINPDGTGVHLKPDGTLDRWGPNAADNAVDEKLSAGEQAYLKKHPNADLRDVAEIHQNLHGDATKIDAFYKSLDKLDSSKKLTDSQKDALREDILHHVANPAEIYQGVTDSCNVSVIQRDLAMTNPAKYASTVAEAVTDGTFTSADGHKTKLDVKNLTMADSSGRDLASRVFQTAALRGEFDPAKVFENTPDGVGRLKPGKDDPPGTRPQPFDGLYPNEIADIRHKLTGEEKAVTFIKTGDDLKKALEENGGPPMTIMVDSTVAPFGDGKHEGDTAPNHVVTITGVEAGPPAKYLVQNQFGLEHDHSTKATAIPADKLLTNMSRHKEPGGTVDSNNGAIVLTNGDHTKAFGIVDGTKAEIPAATQNLAAANRSKPRIAGH